MSSKKKSIECPDCKTPISFAEDADVSKSIRIHCSKSKFCKAFHKWGIDYVNNEAKKQKKRDVDEESLLLLRDKLISKKHEALYEEVTMDVHNAVFADEDPNDTAHLSISESIACLDDSDDKQFFCFSRRPT